MIEIKKNQLTAEIYSYLHEKVNFQEYKKEDITYALNNDLFDIVIFKGGNPIGCARLLGDNRLVFLIKDVIVIPEFQRQGFGTTLIEQLLLYIDENACQYAHIFLMSTKGYESFYEKFGFMRRPNELLGSGMVMYGK